MTDRPSFDKTFMDVADVMARRATCPRLHAATVLVSPDQYIIATGYNGAPAGLPHCTEVGCQMEYGDGRADDHCIRTVHTEVNAVIQAAQHGASLYGATAYITNTPCHRCTVVLVQAGVSEIVCRVAYKQSIYLPRLADYLCAAGVHLYRWYDIGDQSDADLLIGARPLDRAFRVNYDGTTMFSIPHGSPFEELNCAEEKLAGVSPRSAKPFAGL